MKLPSLLKTILQGYLNSGRSVLSALLFLALAGLVSLGIVYPLWLFATSHPKGYTLFCGILLAAALAGWIIYRVISHREVRGNSVHDEAGPVPAPRRNRSRGLKRVAKGLLILFLLYLTILLFGMDLLVPGIIALVLSFFLVGWLLYGPRRV